MEALYRQCMRVGTRCIEAGRGGNSVVSTLPLEWHLPRSFAAKANKSSSSSSSKDDFSDKKGKMQVLIDALSPPQKKREFTEEELLDAAARAKEFSRQKMRQHRAWQAQFMAKVKLRDAAVAALPNQRLRDAAMTMDLTPFPSNRQMWVETPPLETDDLKTMEKESSQKRRRKIGTKNL